MPQVIVTHTIDRVREGRGVLIDPGPADDGSDSAFFYFVTEEECASAADYAVAAGCVRVMRYTEHAFWSPNLAEGR